MPGPVRTRQACDRCHSQKLRCSKQQGSANCTRCARTKATCTFSAIGSSYSNTTTMAARRPDAATVLASPSPSPPSSSLSPGTAAAIAALPPPPPPPPPQSWAADLAAGFSGGVGEGHYVADLSSLPGMAPVPIPDWLALDAALSPAGSFGDLVNSHPAATAAAAAAAAALGTEAETEPEPAPACGRTLAELQVEVDTTLGAMPAPPLLHLPADDDDAVAARLAEMVPQLSPRGFMERIFVVTQRLIDAYPEAVDKALGMAAARREEEPCRISNCVHRHELPPEFDAELLDETTLQSGDVVVVDLALAGQLVSCHLRLLDVLDRLVLYAFSCFRLKVAASRVRHPDFLLPELKVGSFTPVGSSAQLMQVVLIKDMMDRLRQHLKKFADAVGADVSETPSLGTRSLKLQTELLGERQARVSKHFKSISTFLVNRDLTER